MPVRTRARYNALIVLHHIPKDCSSAPDAFMIQAILFDFNGVIIDDEPLQLQAYREALGIDGISITDEDYYRLLGTDDRAFVREIFERAGKPLSDETLMGLIERKTELHREAIKEELPLFPGVVTFIRAAARHYLLGVVSMARRVEIAHVLERARLFDMFACIVSAEDARACKPDPHCYQTAFDLLNQKRLAQRRLPLLAGECLV
ncbi:MAG: HAD family phosphatase, partial [Acidobacteria bacterium]|nr:HAD family phosphatase [Acidobacteriota bacterium]